MLYQTILLKATLKSRVGQMPIPPPPPSKKNYDPVSQCLFKN